MIHVGRFKQREQITFRMEVLTPMFLGGASGDAELRAAPFKNALRYWWRITRGDIPEDRLLKQEQALFGGVSAEAVQSLVTVTVDGTVKTGGVGERDILGNKINPEANGRNVPLSAYLGMGVVHFDGKCLKKRILPREAFTLTVTFPKQHRDEMRDTLSLVKAFATFGARSRNGWGSLDMTPASGDLQLKTRNELFSAYGAELSDIFNVNRQYPFRLGKANQRPLMWLIHTDEDWRRVLGKAGEYYMDCRQQAALVFPKGPPQGVQKRHILGYPVTSHQVREWGGNSGRMPSQLRILVRRHKDRYAAFFFHLPHQLPKPWNTRLGREIDLWQTIHTHLDKHCQRLT